MTNNVGTVNDIPATGNSLPSLENGVESLLEFLTPAQHRVALAGIGQSKKDAENSCPIDPTGTDPVPEGVGPGRTGNWIIPSATNGPHLDSSSFTDQYDVDNSPTSSPPSLNTTNFLVRAADCIDAGSSGTGTWLASPLKFAAKQLLDHGRDAPVKKGILFMTDGVPNERDVRQGRGHLHRHHRVPDDRRRSVQRR
jgi:hypothetical protein